MPTGSARFSRERACDKICLGSESIGRGGELLRREGYTGGHGAVSCVRREMERRGVYRKNVEMTCPSR